MKNNFNEEEGATAAPTVDAAPVRFCHYCGTVQEEGQGLARLNALFCDDACAWDFIDQVRSTGGSVGDDAPKPRFEIDTLAKLEWWSGKLADVDARRKRIKANYQKQLDQLAADEKRALRLQPQAEAFTVAELARTKAKRQSITTLHGTATITNHAASVVLLPDATVSETVLSVARSLGCTRIVPEVPAQPEREEVDTAAYLKAVKAELKGDAPLPPGCDRTPARQSFAFKLAKDEDTAPADE